MQLTNRVRRNGSAKAVAHQSTKQISRAVRRAGHRPAAGAKLVITNAEDDNGKPWVEVDLDAATFACLQRACAELGLTIPQFIEMAIQEHLDKAGHEGAPTADATRTAAVVEAWRHRLVELSDDLSNAHDQADGMMVLLENLVVHPPEGGGEFCERIVNGFVLLRIEASNRMGEAEQAIENFIDELRATEPLKTTAAQAGANGGAQ